MAASFNAEDFLWYAGLAAKAVLTARLLWLGLYVRYKALVICLLAHVVRTLILLPLSVNGNAYAYAYLLTEPLLLVTYVLVALEIYSHVFESYRGLSILGRRTMLAALGVSALVAVVTHLAEFDYTNERFHILRSLFIVESTLCSTLLIFLILLALFLFWYPVPLRKNLLHYSFLWCVVFAALSAGLYLRNANPTDDWTRIASEVRLAADTLCPAAWIWLFRRSWEVETSGVAFRLTSEHQQRILARLDAMNEALEAGRKTT